MRTYRKSILAAFAAALMYSASAYGVTINASASSTVVHFDEVEAYTDIKASRMSSKKAEARVLDSIRESFVKAAAKRLPNGHTLEIRVKDVDLAGDMSPLTSTYGDFRVLREVFPPRIVFDYVVMDAGENVVASGSRRLSNPNYLNTLRPDLLRSDDSAVHVRELVRDWVSNDLARELKR